MTTTPEGHAIHESANLTTGLAEYQQLLARLEETSLPNTSGATSSELLLQVLTRRDALEQLIKTEGAMTPETISRLYSLDQRLGDRLRSPFVDRDLVDKLVRVNPDLSSRWWWQLGSQKSRFQAASLLRRLRIGLLWPLNLAIAASLISKMLASETGVFGLLGIASSVAIPLVQAQRQFAGEEAPGDRGRISRSKGVALGVEISSLIGSLVGTLILSLLWAMLPKVVAWTYYEKGHQSRNLEPDKAMSDFQKALDLDPSSKEANTALGRLYEDHLADLKTAEIYYIKAGLDDIHPLHQLARINLLRKPPNTYASRVFLDKSLKLMGEREKSVAKKREAFDRSWNETVERGEADLVLSVDEMTKKYRINQYALDGWTDLLNQRLEPAIDSLQTAIKIQQKLPKNRLFLIIRSPASPYCLLSQALTSLKRISEAKSRAKECRDLLMDDRATRPDLTKLPEEINWLNTIAKDSP